MSRLLIVSPVPTHPTTAGNRARIAGLMRALEQQGHEPYLLHLPREPGDADAMRAAWAHRYLPGEYSTPPPGPGARLRGWARRRGYAWAHTYGLDEWYDPAIDRQVRQAIETHAIDAVMVEYLFFSKALLAVPPGLPRLLDTHDAFGNRHRRLLEAGMAPGWYACTPEVEARGLKRADVVVAIQDAEADYFRTLGSRPVITVGHLADLLSASTSYPHNATLLAVGSANPINVHALRWLMDEVLPLVIDAHPDARLQVAGGVCGELPARAGVELLGLVDDLQACYDRAQVIVNPMQTGSGLKIKTMEALGAGRALVTTSAGADGLPADGPFRLADTPTAFAAALNHLLADPGAAAALAARGQQFVADYNRRCLQPLLDRLAPPACEQRPAD